MKKPIQLPDIDTRLLKQFSTNQSLVSRCIIGMWQLEAGNVIGAIDTFKKLLRNLPTCYGSMMMLGEALLRNGQPKAAEQTFTKASFSNSPEFLVSLADRVFRHNYWREAIEVLNKAKTLRPNDLKVLLALAKIHWEVYQLTEAKQCCDQVLALAPDNQEVTYMLAALPGRMGNAKKHFEAVKKKYDTDIDPTSRLASSVAMSSLYVDSFSAMEVASLHRELVAPIEKVC